MTLELFRRGAHGIVSREVEPEVLVECLRKVAEGEPGSSPARLPGCSMRIARKDCVPQDRVRKCSLRQKNR